MPTTSFAGYSDIGRKRSRNDDRWAADPALGLYMVADGVGSSTHGDLAAELVVGGLPAYVARHLGGADLHDEQAAARLGGAVAQLSEDLYTRSRTDPSIAGADTTLVAAVITDSRALIVHLGDSRTYLYRDRRVQQLTRDHTIVQAVVDAGELSAEAAARHPNRGVLTRHVLMTPPAKPDFRALDLQPGDRILLCSDGLHGVVDDATLAAILTEHPGPADACRALTDAANQAGGPDNITAVVVNVGPAVSVRPPGPALLDNAAPPPPPPPPAPTARRQAVDSSVAPTQELPLDWAPAPPAPPAGRPSPPIGAPPPQPRRRRRAVMWGLIAAIVVVLAAAVIAGYLLWPRSPASQTPAAQSASPAAQTAQPAPTSLHTLQPAPPPGPIVLPFDADRWPGYVAVDSAGTVYVTDSSNDSKNQRVLVLARGSSTPSVLPFTGHGHLTGLAVDTAGNVYVTDSVNVTSDVDNRVVKLAAGSGIPTALPFTGLVSPQGVALDSAGNVYVADQFNDRVVMLPVGSGTQTVLPFTGLRSPQGVAVDGAGNVYVTDLGNDRVVKLAAGSGTQSVLPFTGLRSPWGVAVDGAGNLYITDMDTKEVVKLAAGSSTQTAPQFNGLFPGVSAGGGVAVDTAGNLYVADWGTHRVVELPAG